MSNLHEGRVHTVIYEDVGSAFYILKMILENGNGSPVTVRGNVPGIGVSIGSWFAFEAKWERHPKFGNQLVVTRAPILKGGWDPDNAFKLLSSNGVGERTLLQIRNHFGDQEFINALSDVDKLQEVPGITLFTATHVSQRWASTQTYFKALGFLSNLGLPAGKIRQIWQTFGDDAEAVLSSNPWALAQVPGIRFTQADEVAVKLGLNLDCIERVVGAVLHACKDQSSSFGHLYMTSGQIFQAVSKFVPTVDKADIGKVLVQLHKEGHLVLDRKTRPGVMAVYEPWFYTLEKDSAELILERDKTAAFGHKKGQVKPKEYIKALADFGPETEKVAKKKRVRLSTVVTAAVEEWAMQTSINLSDAQKMGVINALQYPVSVLTGLPGTGKTTSLKAVVGILHDADVPFLLCAPTGIAAKRLASVTGAPAYTIHRAFSAKGMSNDGRESTYAGIVGKTTVKVSGRDGWGEWGYDEDNPHPAQVVIVDEASMVDQHLMYRLLACTSDRCRLVFVGDAAQLPSVGPGNVLRDLVASARFPVASLTEIFRQEDTSDIVFAAHAVHRGDVPHAGTSGDFVLLPMGSEQEIHDTILRIAQGLLAKRAEFQVLSPRHGGNVGVTKLNESLRALLNPQQIGLDEVRIGKDVIRVHDRIMVIKNNYKYGVFNGDVGKVSSINKKSKEVTIQIYGDPPLLISLTFQESRRLLRMAYACTVHKAQGLEYDVIVMPVVGSFYHQLQRNLYYTAITRARKKVILVGAHQAFSKAVHNAKEDERNTLFLDRILGAQT